MKLLDPSSLLSMASSSGYKSFKYDVFLSFCGQDVRKTFVDHLYHALQQKSIVTYKDDEKINQGNWISDELIGSIEDSKLYIIVFSTNYASSSWCLDELVKIMECHKTKKHTAYPIFYDVEPTEVRNQSWAFGKAFSKLENKEAAEKWRNALTEAANLAGWELKNTADGHENKFIQKIVQLISLELRSIDFRIDEKLVGMDIRINGVLSSLESGSNDVCVIGIKGMGGIGKTTLARAIFDKISRLFDGKSFVETVREVSKASPSGLKSLQNQILSDVFNDKGMTVSSVHEGIHMMKNRMPGKKVLLVLDDVDHTKQIEALAGEMTWFEPGSIIIITTRDGQVLKSYEAKSVHDVRLLSNEEATCLFNRNAFGKAIPNPKFKELSRKVVGYAAGLPLAIKVLGSFLCGKDEDEWTDAISRFKTNPSPEILDILEISYNDLENDYKEMFLNVACFLKGWTKAEAINVLESCGFHAKIGLKVLEQKSLITVNEYGCLGMHDHIEEMGKNIVRRLDPDKPNKHSRLWIDVEIEDILANNLGTKATRYIQLLYLSPEVVMKGLSKMTQLRFLHIETRRNLINFQTRNFINLQMRESDCSRPNSKFYKFPNALRYLHWNSYPFRSLPETFKADNLVALEMPNSKIIQLWEGGERKVLNKLRFLDLSYSMLRTLDLGLTPNIEILNLKECDELVELQMLVECSKLITVDLNGSKLRTLDLRSAPNIELLNINDCSNLVELHMPSISPNLRSLKLRKSKIRTLDIELTPNLKNLEIQNCHDMEELHMAHKCLKMLVHLKLMHCLRFKAFQFCVVSDGSLAELHVNVKSLDECPLHPDSISPKFQLECFYTEDRLLLLTRNLEKIPSVGRVCTNLEKLLFIGLCVCTNLDTLTRNICGLQALRKLKLQGNIPEVPKDLDQLQCLKYLDLSSIEIKGLPDSICMLKYLQTLKLGYCLSLEKLPEDLGQLKCLKYLDLSFTKIKGLPDSICMLKHLQTLKLNDCMLLKKLPEDLGQLECLKYLNLCSTKIEGLPDSIYMLKHLETLKLDDCMLLKKLPEDLGQLECLVCLELSFTKIKGLPDSICMLKHLKVLDISCLLLEKLPEDLGQLECLKKLDLSYCKFLRDIPDSICKMKCLKDLSLLNCIALEKLPKELGRLECLKCMDLRGTHISHLPHSIFSLKGLCITKEIEDAYSLNIGIKSYVVVSPDDLERLRRPGKKSQN